MEHLLNKITQGDCLEVMKEIPDKSIDAIICDPPIWHYSQQVGFCHTPRQIVGTLREGYKRQRGNSITLSTTFHKPINIKQLKVV